MLRFAKKFDIQQVQKSLRRKPKKFDIQQVQRSLHVKEAENEDEEQNDFATIVGMEGNGTILIACNEKTHDVINLH